MNTLTINRRAWFMRWLSFVYKDEEFKDVNFCSLFWGLLLSPIALVIRLLGGAAERGINEVALITSASVTGDRVAAFVQRHDTLTKVVAGVLTCACVVYVVGGLVLLLYFAAWWALLIPGNAAWIGLGIAWLYRNTRLGDFLSTGYHATKDRTCPKIELVES